MKNANVKNVKGTTATKTNAANKIVNLNLSAFAEKLSKVEVKEKKDKDLKYHYPENFTALMIKGIEGKKFRQSLRTKRDKLINNVLFSAKQQSVKKDKESADALKLSVSAFMEFYKTNYRINDLSVKSLSSSNDEAKNDVLKFGLEIIIAVNNAK